MKGDISGEHASSEYSDDDIDTKQSDVEYLQFQATEVIIRSKLYYIEKYRVTNLQLDLNY